MSTGISGSTADSLPGSIAQLQQSIARLEGTQAMTYILLLEIHAKLTVLSEVKHQEVSSAHKRNDYGLPKVLHLTPKEEVIFKAIDEMPGTDSQTRMEVESLLALLENDPCTEALVFALKNLFKARIWGVLCSCGEPATVLWQRNSSYALGGNAKFSHTGPSGRSITHGGYAKVPRLLLVDRPDRRRKHTPKI